jgi:hypothetical protein
LRKYINPTICQRNFDILCIVWIDIFFSLTSTPLARQVRSTEIAPAYAKIRGKTSLHRFLSGYIINIHFRLPQIANILDSIIATTKLALKHETSQHQQNRFGDWIKSTLVSGKFLIISEPSICNSLNPLYRLCVTTPKIRMSHFL